MGDPTSSDLRVGPNARCTYGGVQIRSSVVSLWVRVVDGGPLPDRDELDRVHEDLAQVAQEFGISCPTAVFVETPADVKPSACIDSGAVRNAAGTWSGTKESLDPIWKEVNDPALSDVQISVGSHAEVVRWLREFAASTEGRAIAPWLHTVAALPDPLQSGAEANRGKRLAQWTRTIQQEMDDAWTRNLNRSLTTPVDEAAPDTATPAASPELARLTRLEMKDAGGLDHLDLNLSADLTLVYGPNGSGKTSITRALGMALTGHERDDFEPRTTLMDGDHAFVRLYQEGRAAAAVSLTSNRAAHPWAPDAEGKPGLSDLDPELAWRLSVLSDAFVDRTIDEGRAAVSSVEILSPEPPLAKALAEFLRGEAGRDHPDQENGTLGNRVRALDEGDRLAGQLQDHERELTPFIAKARLTLRTALGDWWNDTRLETLRRDDEHLDVLRGAEAMAGIRDQLRELARYRASGGVLLADDDRVAREVRLAELSSDTDTQLLEAFQATPDLLPQLARAFTALREAHDVASQHSAVPVGNGRLFDEILQIDPSRLDDMIQDLRHATERDRERSRLREELEADKLARADATLSAAASAAAAALDTLLRQSRDAWRSAENHVRNAQEAAARGPARAAEREWLVGIHGVARALARGLADRAYVPGGPDSGVGRRLDTPEEIVGELRRLADRLLRRELSFPPLRPSPPAVASAGAVPLNGEGEGRILQEADLDDRGRPRFTFQADRKPRHLSTAQKRQFALAWILAQRMLFSSSNLAPLLGHRVLILDDIHSPADEQNIGRDALLVRQLVYTPTPERRFQVVLLTHNRELADQYLRVLAPPDGYTMRYIELPRAAGSKPDVWTVRADEPVDTGSEVPAGFEAALRRTLSYGRGSLP